MTVGVCNRCAGPALMVKRGAVIEVACACGQATIPAAFFAAAGRPR